MRNKFMPLAAVAMFAFVPAALAQSATNGPYPSTENATGAQTAIVCVRGDAPTGSRIGAKKVCHTQAEWRVIHATSVDTLQHLQDRGDNGLEGASLAAGH